MKKYKPVYVEWIDSSYSAVPGWQDIEDLAKHNTETCYTTGFLIEKTKKAVRIAGSVHISFDLTELAGVCDIPTFAVKKLRYLN
ncbi:MAG TPA: hypothetical protein DCS07_10580 [Bdellovibrionales bacterium]|nr:hypothetical protein [Bdellovibrionales bacterium]